ncbi:hypothetical protein G6F58_013829 [Rhizopus delemar]|nr:hypothetical protein G6F58_013829 [Rhizopus delemar]
MRWSWCGGSRRRVGTQHFQIGDLRLQGGKGALDVRIVAVAQDINVEIIFPLTGARGARLEAGHRYAVGRQRGQDRKSGV